MGVGNLDRCAAGWPQLRGPERPYLARVEELIRRCINPSDDISARDLLNVESRWSYTVFLAALARYLSHKAECGQLDNMYAYSRASLLHYATWMADNEVAYLDQTERLEFPTETWAAQEFRKANVLRLSAAHADEPLRSRLMRRGDALADRAWMDLYRFESRFVARAAAIVFVEGLRDFCLRVHGVNSFPPGLTGIEFPKVSSFVPQKACILNELKTLKGLLATGRLRLVVQLANPTTSGLASGICLAAQ